MKSFLAIVVALLFAHNMHAQSLFFSAKEPLDTMNAFVAKRFGPRAFVSSIGYTDFKLKDKTSFKYDLNTGKSQRWMFGVCVPQADIGIYYRCYKMGNGRYYFEENQREKDISSLVNYFPQAPLVKGCTDSPNALKSLKKHNYDSFFTSRKEIKVVFQELQNEWWMFRIASSTDTLYCNMSAIDGKILHSKILRSSKKAPITSNVPPKVSTKP